MAKAIVTARTPNTHLMTDTTFQPACWFRLVAVDAKYPIAPGPPRLRVPHGALVVSPAVGE